VGREVCGGCRCPRCCRYPRCCPLTLRVPRDTHGLLDTHALPTHLRVLFLRCCPYRAAVAHADTHTLLVYTPAVLLLALHTLSRATVLSLTLIPHCLHCWPPLRCCRFPSGTHSGTHCCTRCRGPRSTRCAPFAVLTLSPSLTTLHTLLRIHSVALAVAGHVAHADPSLYCPLDTHTRSTGYPHTAE
jgi:hypothetical protein